jgi:hypothetical protein
MNYYPLFQYFLSNKAAPMEIDYPWLLTNQSQLRTTVETRLTHPDVPVETLLEYATSSYENQRAWVAGHKKTPVTYLVTMAQKTPLTATRVIAALLANSQLPLEWVQTFAQKIKSFDFIIANRADLNIELIELLVMRNNCPSTLRSLLDSEGLTEKSLITLTERLGLEEMLSAYEKYAVPNAILPQALKLQIGYKLRFAQCAQLSEKQVGIWFKLADPKARLALMGNKAFSKDVIEHIIAQGSVDEKRSIACNPVLTESQQIKLTSHTRHNILESILSNACVVKSVLDSASLNPDKHIQLLVANHPNTQVKALSRLSRSSFAEVRAIVAKHENTALDDLKKLAGDKEHIVYRAILGNKRLSTIRALKNNALLLVDQACHAFNFMDLHSPKRITKLLINSKHPSEVGFIFELNDCKAIDVLSQLQSVFINDRHKLDRHRYIQFIDEVRRYVPVASRLGLLVEPAMLKKVLSVFDQDLVINILMQYDKNSSADCIRMLAYLVGHENPTTNRNYRDAIWQWINSREGVCLHDYLSNKHNSLVDSVFGVQSFYQVRFIGNVDAVNNELDDDWQINMPLNPQELMTIGDLQRHCVGGKYYAQRCIDGSNVIFQLVPDGNVQSGFTCQFSLQGRLLQAKGFANDTVSFEGKQMARNAFRTLTQNCAINTPTELAA